MLAAISRATASEHEAIYGFWYDVYVKEMGRLIDDPLTDHARRLVRDPLAECGLLLVARDEEQQIVATMLTTGAAHSELGTNQPLGTYETLYGLDQLSASERHTSTITTKLMVAPAFRRTRLPMQLARRGYQITLQAGMQHDYIDCNDHLVPFFLKLGYREHRGRVYHPCYGHVNSMVIDRHDYQHLQQVGSPFARYYQKTEEFQRNAVA